MNLKRAVQQAVATQRPSVRYSTCSTPRVVGAEDNEQGDSVQKEIQRYPSLPQTKNKNEDLLLWWYRNIWYVPKLAKLAKKYLSVPATSVFCRRTDSER